MKISKFLSSHELKIATPFKLEYFLYITFIKVSLWFSFLLEHIHTQEGTRRLAVNVVSDGIGDASSNPGRRW